MLVREYGLFWRADEIDWTPGRGTRKRFRLLGRCGANRPRLRVSDFRYQQGIYILYGNYGPHYVGLTRKQGLGKRLKDHLADDHAGYWDRFSWFGFCRVLKRSDNMGIRELSTLASVTLADPNVLIGDVEALLIKAMDLRNKANMSFSGGTEWIQVKRDEATDYLDKVAPS